MRLIIIFILIASVFLMVDSAFAMGGGGGGGFWGWGSSRHDNPQFADNNGGRPSNANWGPSNANWGPSNDSHSTTQPSSTPTSVPEPIAALLIGIGLVGVAVAQKRRSRRIS